MIDITFYLFVAGKSNPIYSKKLEKFDPECYQIGHEIFLAGFLGVPGDFSDRDAKISRIIHQVDNKGNCTSTDIYAIV